MPRDIRRIETLVPKRAADYGGKACHLAKLARAGFPVPAAFAVPSGAGSIGDWLERLPAIPGLTAPRHPAP